MRPPRLGFSQQCAERRGPHLFPAGLKWWPGPVIFLILFVQTPATEDARRATLIADGFAGFKRLLADSKHPPVAGEAGLAPASLGQRRIAMAKGQQRGTREAKKPKKEKPKISATSQASFGLNPPKSTGAKDDRGKKK
ncbi:MAG: hypothetical protein ACRED2_04925 [Methylocella sp.]